MKILIIGSKGTLGQALVAEFTRDHEVLAWDRDEIDITDPPNSKLKINNEKPDLLINSAAFTDVDGAEKNKEAAIAVNATGPENLAKICKELDIPLVHYSTEHVFDGEKEEGYKENDSTNPINVYGKSKLKAEEAIQEIAEKYYIFRLSRLFGITGGGKKSFVDLMLKLADEKGELEVVNEEVSSPTYAPDLASLTREIIEKDYEYGIYHCANAGSCTWYEFAQEIFKITGKNVKLKPVPASHFPRPAKRPKYAVLLNTKLPETRPWQEALKEFLNG